MALFSITLFSRDGTQQLHDSSLLGSFAALRSANQRSQPEKSIKDTELRHTKAPSRSGVKEMNHVVLKHPIGVVDRESIPWELFNGPAYEVETLPAETDSEVTIEHCFIASASFGSGACCALPFADVPSARAFLGSAKRTSLGEGDVQLTIYRAAVVWSGTPGLMLQSTSLLTDAWLDADALSAHERWKRFAEM